MPPCGGVHANDEWLRSSDLNRGQVIPATQIDSKFERLRGVVARPLAFYTGVVCVATLLAFAGRWSWFCDLLVNFRTHYALLLSVAFAAAAVSRSWRVAGVAAVGLALNLWPMYDAFAGSRSSPVAGARSVRLVSFNVHVANGDMARVAAYLESLQADIVVFQEMTRTNADRIDRVAAAPGASISARRSAGARRADAESLATDRAAARDARWPGASGARRRRSRRSAPATVWRSSLLAGSAGVGTGAQRPARGAGP